MWLRSLTAAVAAIALACIGVQAAPANDCPKPFNLEFNDASGLGLFDYNQSNLVSVNDGNLAISISKDNVLTSLRLTKPIRQGKVRARIKAGLIDGVYTTFTMKGIKGDEVGLRWLGKSPGHVRAMFFVEGRYVIRDDVPEGFDLPNGDASADYFIYTLEFTDQEVNYYIDDELKYTVKNKNDGKFPTGADHLVLEIWDDNLSGGSAEKPDYSKAQQYSAYIDWIEVTPYCNGRKFETMPPSAVIAEGELIPKC